MNDNNTQDNQFEALETHPDPWVRFKLNRYKQLLAYEGGNRAAIQREIRKYREDLEAVR